MIEAIKKIQQKKLLLWLLVMSPALYHLIAIALFSVNVPFWDQWDFVPFFEKWHQGTLTFWDLFAQKVDHHQFFPNLIFVALGVLTKWNVRYEMFVSLLLALITSYALIKLILKTSKRSISDSWLGLFLLNCFLFSPVQIWNWLYGVQVVFFLPNACFALGLMLSVSSLIFWQRFIICLILAIIANFSTANGVLCWPLFFISLFTCESINTSLSKKRIAGAIWFIAFASCIVLYLSDYHRTEGQPEILVFLKRPLHYIAFVLAMLGRPLETIAFTFDEIDKVGWYRYLGLPYAALLGSTLSLGWLGSAIYCWRRRQDQVLVANIVPWLCLGAYSILTSAMIALARLGYGTDQALAPRYTTFAIFLPVSLVGLSMVIIRQLKQENKFLNWHKITITAVVTILSLQILYLAGIGAQKLILNHERTKKIAACLRFSKVINDSCIESILYPDSNLLKQRALVLNRLGYLNPPLLQTASLKTKATDAAHIGSSNLPIGEFGTIDSLAILDDGSFFASGRAALPNQKLFSVIPKGPDTVLLTYEKDKKPPRVFALAMTTDVPHKSLGVGIPEVRLYWHWQLTKVAPNFPTGEITIRAWAYDTQNNQAFALDGARTITIP